ncbi:MAG: phosphoribosylanthranilate isomerase [Treponema sp.]|nr:phosphoribosylanthranilate isomerase [Treponema sp.]
MRIKICGLFRDEDIDYVNEARPDYAGFVFAQSKRQVSPPLAQYLRFRLADSVVPVGVFMNAPVAEVAALYQNGTISVAQLHGAENEGYISQLKKKCDTNNKQSPIRIIKVIKSDELKSGVPATGADFYLIDSGAGSGKSFNWNQLHSIKIEKPWFLAGGIDLKNIGQAMALNPFAVDVSSGAETDGIKDREKILELVSIVRKGK